eukprot:Unigene11356_Nuclearia_a/m.34670 Unigene11356_Nuclearia_a/g.34670  ORF Unigene11356_Nuclearia_a/g.34670 Unigene11356_Nuclearia_a/m.34670 type:complete len:109 (-) Unigene11356_Nuclearia_a:205-531(-)
MTRNMRDLYAHMPRDTLVYPGHEYTVANLKFAESVEPDNAAVKRKLAWAQERRAAGEPTVPSTIGEELEHNPFMRLESPAIQAATGQREPVAVMHALREAKNNFKASL